MAGRRIGFLIDWRLFRTANGVRAESPMVRFALGFRAHFDEIVLIARVFERAETELPYAIPDEGVRVVALPPYPRIHSLYTRPLRWWPPIERALQGVLPELDALWLNFGHPVSHRALALSERHPKLRPFAVLRGAYERDAALRTDAPAPVRGLAGAVMSLQMRAFARRARRRDLACVGFGTGQRLRAMGLRTLPMVSSLLRARDLERGAAPDSGLACDLLVVGRLAPEKGVDVLLEALPKVEAPGGPAVLRVVGSGESDAALRAQARRLGVADRVAFDGHVPFGPALFGRYASAALVVVPSHTEGIPKSAYEAMAFGRPVLATAVGGLPDVVGRDGERGRLVPPGDPEALARAASELLADPEGLERRGEAARAFARETTLERQVERIVRFIAPDWLEAA